MHQAAGIINVYTDLVCGLVVVMQEFAMLRASAFLCLFLSITSLAIEKPTEAEGVDEASVNEEDVLELDRMSVQGERLTLRKESRLRIVRQGLNEERSYKKEDRDKMLCWLETPVGTHFKHITCARNGDLEALRHGGKDGQIGGAAGYGRHKFWRSIRADNEATIRNILNDLPRNSYFDEEFALIATNGGEPPRDVPEEDELQRFAKAWIKVQKMTGESRPEEEVVEAIESGGLSLARYNRIVALAESYTSIKAKLTEFVIEEQGNSEETF